MWQLFKELVFPSCCLNCKREVEEGRVVCEGCLSGIRVNQTLFCGQCLARLPDGRKVCHKDFPYLLGAALDYKDEAVKNLILGLKFKRVRSAAKVLGELLVQYAQPIFPDWQDFLVVPVPLGRMRKNERGFNQSELLAEVFAKNFKSKISIENLTRIKNTTPQSELSGFEKRRGNVKDVFRVSDPSEFAGQNIVLMDDVTTSGATFEEAAEAIKSCHPKRIVALAAAKA